MASSRRSFANPWPRMALAAVLMIWSGANLWVAVFHWREIMVADVHNRTVGLGLTSAFIMVPMVVALHLLWTVVARIEAAQGQSRATKG